MAPSLVTCACSVRNAFAVPQACSAHRCRHARGHLTSCIVPPELYGRTRCVCRSWRDSSGSTSCLVTCCLTASLSLCVHGLAALLEPCLPRCSAAVRGLLVHACMRGARTTSAATYTIPACPGIVLWRKRTLHPRRHVQARRRTRRNARSDSRRHRSGARRRSSAPHPRRSTRTRPTATATAAPTRRLRATRRPPRATRWRRRSWMMRPGPRRCRVATSARGSGWFRWITPLCPTHPSARFARAAPPSCTHHL